MLLIIVMMSLLLNVHVVLILTGLQMTPFFYTGRSLKSQASEKRGNSEMSTKTGGSTKLETTTVYTDLSEAGIPQPINDDMYGIPILELSSSDSDVSSVTTC